MLSLYFPFAVLLTFTLLYRNDLGILTTLIYWLLWLAFFLTYLFSEILSSNLFLSIQATLAAIMFIHIKLKQSLT